MFMNLPNTVYTRMILESKLPKKVLEGIRGIRK